MKITTTDLKNTAKKYPLYPQIGMLLNNPNLEMSSEETCNHVLSLFQLILVPAKTVNSDTTGIRSLFEELLVGEYVSKAHMLAVYDFLGYSIRFKRPTDFYYDCNVKINRDALNALVRTGKFSAKSFGAK